MDTLVYEKTNNKKEIIKWKVVSPEGDKNFLEVIFNASSIFNKKKVVAYNGDDMVLHFPDENIVISFQVRDEDEILRMIEEYKEEI